MGGEDHDGCEEDHGEAVGVAEQLVLGQDRDELLAYSFSSVLNRDCSCKP